MRQLTFGTDPEFFIQSNGALLPVCGLLGGTKEKHIPMPFGEIHEDGTAAELTVPPSETFPGMLDLTMHTLMYAKEYISGKVYGGTVHNASEVRFPTAVLAKIGPQAMTFGCSPEYDAYQRGASVPVLSPAAFERGTDSLRFAGGHIHIGYKAVQPEVSEYVVAMLCDATFGLQLVRAGEKQPERRRFYGRPGRFRPTPYGMEYRTPSNAWLMDRYKREGLMDAADRFVQTMRSSPEAIRAKWNSIDWPLVCEAIIEEDQGLADQLWAAY